MPFSRRQLLTRSVAAAAVAAAARSLPAWARPAATPAATLDPSRLPAFVDALPRLALAHPEADGSYRMTMRAADCQLHRDLPPTRCWTYNGTFPGPTIVARSHQPVQVEWINALPAQHFLPIDTTLGGAGPGMPPVRAVVHLHGARVPAASDGYPEAWYTPGHSQLTLYPNPQDAALLFYHDHAMGINRLNVYAGLGGLYRLGDAQEDHLIASAALPGGDYEIPLVLCDRWLTPQAQLYYPISAIPGRPWVPEVFGNIVLVNGKLLPHFKAEPHAYRFRIANFANSRFFNLTWRHGPARAPMHAVGSDQGLLAAPAPLTSLLLAPAERGDVVVDFAAYAGQDVLLYNDALPILRVRVAAAHGTRHRPWRPPQQLRPLPRTPAVQASTSRSFTLDEYDDLAANPMTMLLNGKYWREPVTEQPELGTTEIWEFLNLTDDTHPIHLHLVRFQVLDRRPFDSDQYQFDGTLRYTGLAQPPAPEEMGWKDTVRAYPDAVTRIIVSFDSFAGRYLWHCHILEHEAKDMMRPFEILPRRAPDRP